MRRYICMVIGVLAFIVFVTMAALSNSEDEDAT